MYKYESTVIWRREKEGEIRANQKPDIRVATPPDFGGPAGVWSAEELFVGSVASCLMSTFLYFVERLGIRLRSYSSSAAGFMEKTPDGLRFKAIDVPVVVEVGDESDFKKATELKEKLEKYCPISASLGFPVNLEVKATIVGEHEGPENRRP